jgi:hypothetical protein
MQYNTLNSPTYPITTTMMDGRYFATWSNGIMHGIMQSHLGVGVGKKKIFCTVMENSA